MNMPGFSAEASVAATGARQKCGRLSVGDNQIGIVVPAQVCCGTVSGPCNGPFGALVVGRVSTTVVGGVPFSCFLGWQYAFTNVCRDLSTGAITSRTNGCGFCFL
jgi:hypothetical protein